MVDTIAGDSSTTTTIGVGGTLQNTLETAGDHDWVRINLNQGQEITVFLEAITSTLDPYLRIRNSSGTVIWESDDINIGVNLDSLLSFQATYTGVYYIDVGAFDSTNNAGEIGDYRLTVSPYQDPPVWTNDQIATQLVSGYWGDGQHRFNASPGGQITVNITGLTTAGQALAIAALQTWTDIIGITFVQTSSPSAQIVFTDDDLDGGAFTDATYSNGVISTAQVNVDAGWLASYGDEIGDYSFQAYVHEIGHALGLGHAGNYNTTAEYPYQALFANDGWPATIMSYFSQTESSYYVDRNFTHAYVVTPMVADIIAMQQLYGLSSNTRSGDTTYGYNSNAGVIYDATQTTGVALTIFDTGGNDTLDYSESFNAVRLDLNPESYSNVFGDIGNLSIARGTIIENAIGGTRADTLIGNSAANVLSGGGGRDSLTGGLGNDTFRDTAAGLDQDTITDLSVGDRIVITDAAFAGFSYNLAGNTLNFTGGSLTLSGGVNGTIIASAAAGGGVQLTIQQAIANDVRNDFNGDGRSDILWRNDAGALSEWLGQGGGTFAYNPNAAYQVDVNWRIAAFADFNGDGRDDVLWRHNNGGIMEWLGQSDGTFAYNPNAVYQLGTNWSLGGTGDFNGDGRDDILWRNEVGAMSQWLGQANGTFVYNPNAAYQLPTNWELGTVGDFNGDGRDDILWRNEVGAMSQWLGQANGTYVYNGNAAYQLPTNWALATSGDFNGDGRDDILWRNEVGAMSQWLGQADGTFVYNGNAAYQLPTNWQLATSGDFNGDGRDDVMWRNEVGALSEWLGQANGTFAYNPNAAYLLPTTWHIQPDVLL